MRLLKFEFRKMLKHKKIIWLFIIVSLVIFAVFSLNSFQRSRLQGKWVVYTALDEFNTLYNECAKLHLDLLSLAEKNELGNIQENQLTHVRNMSRSLARIRVFIQMDRWEEINELQKDFFLALENYEKHQGQFKGLDGLERKIAKDKNAWLIENNLAYEVEKSPTNQHLFLTQISTVFFSLFGILILLVLFGNTITQEKEQKTWLTIKTQPVSKIMLIFSKYITCVFSTIFLIISVFALGFLLPQVSDGLTLNLQYPQVLIRGETYEIISTGEYLYRSLVAFFCVSSIVFSLALLVSKLVNKSYNLYFWVGIIISVGYIEANITQSYLNPLNSLVHTQNIGLKQILLTLAWILFFFLISAYIPEREIQGDQIIRNNRPFASGRIVLRNRVLSDICSFEWRKLRREGILLVFFSALLIIVVVGHIFLKQQTESRERSYLNELEYRLAEVNEKLVEDNNVRDRNSDIRLKYRLESALTAYEEGDWKTFYDYQLHVTRSELEKTFPFGQVVGRPITIGRFTKQVSIDEKIWLQNRDIQPVLAGEFITAIHQNWRGNTRIGWGGQEVRQPQWEKENKKVDNNGLFSLYLTYTHYLYIIPLLLLLIAIGGGVAKEKGKKRTFNFLKIQPFSEKDVYVGKLLNAFTITIVTVIVVVLLIISVGSLLNRFGDWDYPILHYNSFKSVMDPNYSGRIVDGRGYHFISLAEFLAYSTLLMLVLSFFVIAFTLLMSLILKNTSAVLISSILTLIIGYWQNWRRGLRMHHYSPFAYFDIPKIVDGQLATITNNPKINVLTGSLVLGAFTFLFVVLSLCIIYREKLKELVLRVFNLLQKKIKKGNSIDEST